MSSAGQIVAIAIGLCGLAGVVFTALKYNRNDTTEILQQQDQVFGELRDLTAELRVQRDEAKQRCDDCLEKLASRG